MSFHALWLSWFLLFMNQQVTSTITLTINMLNSDAVMIGVPVSLQDEMGDILAECVSDENGRCLLTVTAPTGSIIRGILDLGPSGQRSIIFTIGENIEMTLELDRFGHLQQLGHDPHPTLESFTPPSQALLTPAPTKPPAPTATPVYVVVNPESVITADPPPSAPPMEIELVPSSPITPETSPQPEDTGIDWVRLLVLMVCLFVICLIGLVFYGGHRA